MRSTVAIALTVLTLAGTAAAQPALAPPGLVPPTPAPSSPQDGHEVSEGTALAIALGGTVASYGLLVLSANLDGDSGARSVMTITGAFGVMFAPSAGRWYAGSRSWRGVGLRAAGLGTAVIAAAVLLSECGLFSEHNCNPTGGTVLLVGAAGLWVGGTLDDIIMAPRDARHHNEQLHQLTVVPLVQPNSRSLGLGIAARF